MDATGIKEARVEILQRALDILETAGPLTGTNEDSEVCVLAVRGRIAELESVGDAGGPEWDAQNQQREEILWIVDQALQGHCYDWDESVLLWVEVQIQLRVASLLFPPERSRVAGGDGAA